MNLTEAQLKEALMSAFTQTIQRFGLRAFKSTPMFASNRVNRAEKAAA